MVRSRAAEFGLSEGRPGAVWFFIIWFSLVNPVRPQHRAHPLAPANPLALATPLRSSRSSSGASSSWDTCCLRSRAGGQRGGPRRRERSTLERGVQKNTRRGARRPSMPRHRSEAACGREGRGPWGRAPRSMEQRVAGVVMAGPPGGDGRRPPPRPPRCLQPTTSRCYFSSYQYPTPSSVRHAAPFAMRHPLPCRTSCHAAPLAMPHLLPSHTPVYVSAS